MINVISTIKMTAITSSNVTLTKGRVGMKENAEIVFSIIEEITIVSNLKGICVNNMAICLLINRLIKDDHSTSELLTYFVERLYTEINILKNNEAGVRFFVIDIAI